MNLPRSSNVPKNTTAGRHKVYPFLAYLDLWFYTTMLQKKTMTPLCFPPLPDKGQNEGLPCSDNIFFLSALGFRI